MNRSCIVGRIFWMLCGAIAGLAIIATATAQGPDSAAEAADRAFVQALFKADRAALAGMLDANFTSIDVNGRSQTAADIARALPKPAIADEAQAKMEYHAYGAFASVQAHSG